ncbi:MAG TPA: hypothetical protein VMW83_06340 [Spirochaetia bacterium]|nr:hypothetical protein [Spirochaetia bacterium]
MARLSAREAMDYNLKEALDLVEHQLKKYAELVRSEKNQSLKEIYGLLVSSRRDALSRLKALMNDLALGTN